MQEIMEMKELNDYSRIHGKVKQKISKAEKN